MSTLRQRLPLDTTESGRLLTVSVADYEIDLLVLGMFVLLAVLPIFGLLSSSLLTSFAVIFMLAGLAMSWNLIHGLTGYPDFGLAAYFGGGAYVLAIGGEKLNLPSQIILGFPMSFYIYVVLAFVGFMLVGLLFKPLMQGNRQYYFAFATLIVFLLISESFSVLSFLQGYSPGINGWPVYVTMGDFQGYYVLLFALVVVTAAFTLVKQSKFGYGLITLREDLNVARSLGIQVSRLRVLAMGIYCGTVAVFGVLYAAIIGWASPDVLFRVEYTLLPIAIVFAGGPGKIRKVFFAGIVILVGRELINQTIPRWSTATFGVFLIILSLVIVQGGPSQTVKNIVQKFQTHD